MLDKNESIIFLPCGAHSLKHVGVNAAKLNADVMTFFGHVASLYSFFSSMLGSFESAHSFITAELP